MSDKKYTPSIWYSDKNEQLSCKEKIIVLNENILEFHDLAEEIYDEAILMGVNRNQIKEVLVNIVNNINSLLKITDHLSKNYTP